MRLFIFFNRMIKKENYLSKVLDNIMETAELNDLPPAEKSSFRDQLEIQIMRRLGIIIIDNLDEKGLLEYENLISKEEMPPGEEFQLFLEKHISDYEPKLKAAINELMSEIMSVMMK